MDINLHLRVMKIEGSDVDLEDVAVVIADEVAGMEVDAGENNSVYRIDEVDIL